MSSDEVTEFGSTTDLLVFTLYWLSGVLAQILQGLRVFIPLQLRVLKIGTMRPINDNPYNKLMKRICRAKFPLKTLIVKERENFIGTYASSLSIQVDLKSLFQ